MAWVEKVTHLKKIDLECGQSVYGMVLLLTTALFALRARAFKPTKDAIDCFHARNVT